MRATSSGFPKILISCTNVLYVHGSLRQGIEPFHFPVVITFYQLAFAIFGIYQLLTSAWTIPFLSVSQLMTLAMGQWFRSLTSVFNSTISPTVKLRLDLLHFDRARSEVRNSFLHQLQNSFVMCQFFSISFYCSDLVFQKSQEVESQLLTSLSTNLKLKWQVHWYHLQWFQWNGIHYCLYLYHQSVQGFII